MRIDMRDGDEFTHKGFKFTFKSEYDQDAEPPWENDCGAGLVTDWTPYSHGEGKRPGYRELCRDRGLVRFYDWQKTMKVAKRDGWGVSWESESRPERKLNEFQWNFWYAGLTRGAKAHLAVEQDFQRMRAWCNGEWSYIGVIVTHKKSGVERSLWRIESDGTFYIDVAHELADEIISEVRASHQKAG